MKHFKSVIALTAICAAISLLLALTNSITAPLIEKNAAAEANAALLIVHPDGGEFTQLDLTGKELPATVTEAYSASNGGYVVKLLTSGYGSDMVLMCGIDANGTVTGATCLSSTETLGYEKTYGDSLAGKTVEDIDSVEAISGATKTTAAYKNAVKDALNATIILGGGSVDIRSEEEILNDNLKEALPAGEGKFVSWFMVEELENVTAVYEAENGVGYVLVSGEEFIAIDKTGAVLTTVIMELDVPVTKAPLFKHHFCRDCRKLLADQSGYVIADLYVPGTPIIIPITDGMEQELRCYKIMAALAEDAAEYKLIVEGTYGN